MAMAKRPAKRIAPKTLEKMRAARVEKEKEQKDLTWLKTKEDRIKQIERQREHLLNQPKATNTYKDALLLEYRTKARTEATKQARENDTITNTLKTKEGIIIDKKKHNELLKRNEVALNNARLAKERAEISKFLNSQERLINGKNMTSLSEAHDKIKVYLMKKYNSKKIDYNKLKEILEIIDYSIKSGIRQHNILISRKNPEYIEQHSRIISRCLLSFMKTQNRVALKENLNLISSSITKNERNMGQALYELDKVIR